MFGRRERERGRRVAAEAFPFLEEVLDHELEVRARTTTPDTARYGAGPVVERLLTICDGDPHAVIAVLRTWWERYDERGGDDDRSKAASAVYLAIGINGFGNLFGAIPDDAPTFDPELAAEGRARGWRR
jgi:hypothetical protein